MDNAQVRYLADDRHDAKARNAMPFGSQAVTGWMIE